MATTDADVLNGIKSQINELEKLSIVRKVTTDSVLRRLSNLKNGMSGVAADTNDVILDRIIKLISNIQAGSVGPESFGEALGDLETLAVLAAGSESPEKKQLIAGIIDSIEKMLNYRPDVQAIMEDLEAIKDLRGGPADATAFHDFYTLQIAFKSVWKHAFDQNLQALVEELYKEHTKLFDDAGIQLPPFDAINDIENIKQLRDTVMNAVAEPTVLSEAVTTVTTGSGKTVVATKTYQPYQPVTSVPCPTEVLEVFPGAGWAWAQLSVVQQSCVLQEAKWAKDMSLTQEVRDQRRKIGQAYLDSPDGPGGRIVKLVYRLNLALSEPYSFDVFAPNTYNFGLMLTYRQKWEPGKYQAGNLVSTIPLAPGETRKYTRKETVKRSRTYKEIEKSIASSSFQSTETKRAEEEIMNKASLATNFKMSANGSFSVGLASINAATEFALNQGLESATTKKGFRESTIKAAQEYRLERNLEVDTTSIDELEQSTSGEISNPNNEITVTYLFYELQRRYKISEFLYRAQPVILVALDVPAPHEIDEAWLLQYQWIISRVLLDDSFRQALNYLSSGFAGDEVAINIIKANWEAQASLVKSLEGQVEAQLDIRDKMREIVIETTLQKDLIPEMPGALKIFTGGADPSDAARDMLEASRKAGETRLKYTEEALADLQNKLKQASDSFQQVTKSYSEAMQNQFSRHVAIDQLRVHVKQNILYYMQAIWCHKVADQTFFELYRLPIDCPDPSSASLQPNIRKRSTTSVLGFKDDTYTLYGGLPAPTSNWDQHELVEMADIDNPLGFKGNYIILPLKEHCYLTWFMLHEFIDGYTKGLRDPDNIAYFLENFPRLWEEAIANGLTSVDGEPFTQVQLKARLEEYASTANRTTEEIIVPTGQLFIEALPGSHPLLEDFKLEHRLIDIQKVKAEVRHAELENLRRAERIIEGKLEDPDIEKKIIVTGNAGVTVGDN